MDFRPIAPSTHKNLPLPGAFKNNPRMADIQAIRDALIIIDEQLNTATTSANEVNLINVDTQAVKNNIYIFTASVVLTLPLDPVKNDSVTFSNKSNTNTCIINRNGSKIMGIAENVTIDMLHGMGTLVYTDATRGWVLV